MILNRHNGLNRLCKRKKLALAHVAMGQCTLYAVILPRLQFLWHSVIRDIQSVQFPVLQIVHYGIPSAFHPTISVPIITETATTSQYPSQVVFSPQWLCLSQANWNQFNYYTEVSLFAFSNTCKPLALSSKKYISFIF